MVSPEKITCIQEGLFYLRENPDRLVPRQLVDALPGKHTYACCLKRLWLGRMDNEYLPDLALLITEQSTSDEYTRLIDEKDGWTKALHAIHNQAIKEGLVLETDRPLISCLAHSISGDGVEILSFTIAKDLRGRGIGQGFYDDLEILLTQAGYKYLCGENDSTNINFFIDNRGRYQASQLDQVSTCNSLRQRLSWNRSPYFTVKFLDKELELVSVKKTD